MIVKYKRRDPKFKMTIALEAAKNLRQIKDIAREYNVHPKQVTEWRDKLLQGAEGIFSASTSTKNKHEDENERLKKIIGNQALELDWLKKKLER